MYCSELGTCSRVKKELSVCWRLPSTELRLSPWKAADWPNTVGSRSYFAPSAYFTPSATSGFYNLSALPSSALALLPGKLSPQRNVGSSRPLLRVPGPEDFPSSSKQSPRPDSHWSRLGHVPILELMTVANGIWWDEWLACGSQFHPNHMDVRETSFSQEKLRCCYDKRGGGCLTVKTQMSSTETESLNKSPGKDFGPYREKDNRIIQV